LNSHVLLNYSGTLFPDYYSVGKKEKLRVELGVPLSRGTPSTSTESNHTKGGGGCFFSFFLFLDFNSRFLLLDMI